MKTQTIEQLNQLKLPAFIEVLDEIDRNTTHQLSHSEAIGMMAQREIILRENKRLARLLKSAKLRYPTACVSNIDYNQSRKFNKNQIRELTHCEWITNKRNIIFTGATGTGKSYLACALAHQACQKGHRAHYTRVNRLTEQLKLSHADGSYTKLLERMAKVQVLILDDWGIDQLDRQERRDLLEVIEDRYEQSSTIITSQLPVQMWHNFIGDNTIADAVCDRLINNAYKIDIKGDSMRKTHT